MLNENRIFWDPHLLKRTLNSYIHVIFEDIQDTVEKRVTKQSPLAHVS